MGRRKKSIGKPIWKTKCQGCGKYEIFDKGQKRYCSECKPTIIKNETNETKLTKQII